MKKTIFLILSFSFLLGISPVSSKNEANPKIKSLLAPFKRDIDLEVSEFGPVPPLFREKWQILLEKRNLDQTDPWELKNLFDSDDGPVKKMKPEEANFIKKFEEKISENGGRYILLRPSEFPFKNGKFQQFSFENIGIERAVRHKDGNLLVVDAHPEKKIYQVFSVPEYSSSVKTLYITGVNGKKIVNLSNQQISKEFNSLKGETVILELKQQLVSSYDFNSKTVRFFKEELPVGINKRTKSIYEDFLISRQYYYSNSIDPYLEMAEQIKIADLNHFFAEMIDASADDFARIRIQTAKDKTWFIAPTMFGVNKDSKWRYIKQQGDILYASFYLYNYYYSEGENLGKLFDSLKNKIKKVPYFKNDWYFSEEKSYEQLKRLVIKNKKNSFAQPEIVLEVRGKRTLPGYIRMDIKIPVKTARNKTKNYSHCLAGDCLNGYGKYWDDKFYGIYEGFFKNGLFQGPGKQTYQDDLFVFSGSFNQGKREGAGITFYLKGYTISELSNYLAGVYQPYYRTIEEKDFEQNKPNKDINRTNKSKYGFHFGPYLNFKGKCLEGNCDYGKGKIEFPGVGIYEGNFAKGVAYGRGVLYLKSGLAMLVNTESGLPILQRTVISENKDLNSIPPYKKTDKVLECLAGDCLNGTGIALIDWIAMLNSEDLPEFYKGPFRDGLPHGFGEVYDHVVTYRMTGNFVNGKREGTFTDYHKYASIGFNTPYQYILYNDGRKISETLAYSPLGQNLTTSRPNPVKKEDSYISVPCQKCSTLGTITIFETVTTKEYDYYLPILPGQKDYSNWYGHTFNGYMNNGGSPREKTYQVPVGKEICFQCQGKGFIRHKR